MYLVQAPRGASLTARRGRTAAAVLALLVIGLDQLTKALVVANLQQGGSRPIIDGVLWLSHVRNEGAAFGLLQGLGGLLALIAVVGVIVFAAIVVRRPPPMTSFGAALVAAGATGNLIDRLVRTGGVVDFVDFRFWPSFNVADSSIFVGAALLLFAGWREGADADR